MLRSFWLQEICRVSVRGTMQTQMEMSAAPLTPSQKSFSQVRALLCTRPSHKAQINVDSSALWTACTRAGFLLAPITLQDIQPPPCSQQGKLSPWCERNPTKPWKDERHWQNSNICEWEDSPLSQPFNSHLRQKKLCRVWVTSHPSLSTVR